MTTSPTPLQLRRLALAVSVLDDVDVRPHATGVALPGIRAVRLTWPEMRRAVAGAEPDSDLARARLARWMHLRRWIADHHVEQISEQARPIATYVEDPEHPGLDWVRMRVLGDTLDVGVGIVGADPRDPDAVVPIPETVAQLSGLQAALEDWWPSLLVYLERMGQLAAERQEREPTATIRPMGDCDVVTLLASRAFRASLVDSQQGMRAVAVPTRARGWLEMRAIDPAFALVAAHLADSRERGLPRPALLTRDEVVMVREGGAPVEIVLRDPAPAEPERHLRPVTFR